MRVWTYRTHEGVEHTDSEGGTAGERLRHVQFSVRIVVIILIQKLHVRVITCIGGEKVSYSVNKSILTQLSVQKWNTVHTIPLNA